MAAGAARPSSTTSTASSRRAPHGDVHPAGAGVLGGVGQGLLQHPVRRPAGVRRHAVQVAVPGHLTVSPAARELPTRSSSASSPGLPASRSIPSTSRTSRIDSRLADSIATSASRATSGARVEGQPPGARLHRDATEAVTEHVVQVPGDPQPLLRGRPPGLRLDPGPALADQLGGHADRDRHDRGRHDVVGPPRRRQVGDAAGGHEQGGGGGRGAGLPAYGQRGQCHQRAVRRHRDEQQRVGDERRRGDAEHGLRMGPAPEQRHPLRQRQQQADGAQRGRRVGAGGPVRRPSTSTTVTTPAITRSRRCQDRGRRGVIMAVATLAPPSAVRRGV